MTYRKSITPKIVLSFVLFTILTGIAVWIVYKGIANLTFSNTDDTAENQKILSISKVLNDLYASEGLARSATQTASWGRFDNYKLATDTVKLEIEALKETIQNKDQIAQLDSIQKLIDKKTKNIEALVSLKQANSSNEIIQKAKKELFKVEHSLGGLSRENIVKPSEALDPERQRFADLFIEYINNNLPKEDVERMNKATFDSLIFTTKNIVNELQEKSKALERNLNRKELQLLQNDITISQQLRSLLTIIETEIIINTIQEDNLRKEAINQTSNKLTIVGICSVIIILFFSFLILKDVSRSQKYRKQLEIEKNYSESLLKSREHLLSSVSHDLRTPLNTIVGYTELLQKPLPKEKQQNYITNLKKSTAYATKLMNDLLDYSKLEAGKITIEKAHFNLRQLIEETSESVKILYPRKPIELILSIDEELNQSFYIDAFRLKQILINLISNAFKFTSYGSIEIKASIEKEMQEKHFVKFEIIDTGIGIKEAQQALIFKEFTQADERIERTYGGSGLGLTITKKLVALLEGTIDLKSKEHHGSTFTLKFPIEKNPLKIKESPKITLNTRPLPANNIIAVIIDDDESQLALIAELLQHHKISSRTFTNAKDALKYMKNNSFDIVFTDIQMPTMDGFQLLKSLQKQKNYQQQPIIAITGTNDASELFLKKGFAHYIPKPFQSSQLIQALNKFGEHRYPLMEMKEMQTLEENVLYDLGDLRNLMQQDEQSVSKILATFSENSIVNIELLKKVRNEKNIVQAKKLAHRMCGMFNQIHAIQIVGLLNELEHFSLSQNSYEGFRLKIETTIEKIEFLLEEIQTDIKA